MIKNKILLKKNTKYDKILTVVKRYKIYRKGRQKYGDYKSSKKHV